MGGRVSEVAIQSFLANKGPVATLAVESCFVLLIVSQVLLQCMLIHERSVTKLAGTGNLLFIISAVSQMPIQCNLVDERYVTVLANHG